MKGFFKEPSMGLPEAAIWITYINSYFFKCRKPCQDSQLCSCRCVNRRSRGIVLCIGFHTEQQKNRCPYLCRQDVEPEGKTVLSSFWPCTQQLCSGAASLPSGRINFSTFCGLTQSLPVGAGAHNGTRCSIMAALHFWLAFHSFLNFIPFCGRKQTRWKHWCQTSAALDAQYRHLTERRVALPIDYWEFFFHSHWSREMNRLVVVEGLLHLNNHLLLSGLVP